MDAKTLIDKYQAGERDFSGVNLSGANLRGANLRWANLREANLRDADLRDADLSEANLYGANLRWADLRRANLQGADLHGTDLSQATLYGANLSEAKLSHTCLDPHLHEYQRNMVKSCNPRSRGLIVYRTATSWHCGNTEYIPGRTYIAPMLSFSAETACHPGIYAGTLSAVRESYPEVNLVRCYVRAGDWVITAKGMIRCKRIRVLGYVEE